MADTPEVRVPIKLEDLASEVLKQIRGEVEETDKKVDESKQTWGNFASSAVQHLHYLGVNLKDVANQVTDFGASFIDAAAGGQSADTALGGLISAVQDIPFSEAEGKAKALHDRIDEIAMQSGAVGNVEEAFHKIVDFTGATEKGIGRSTGAISALANISGVLGKDIGAISQEFSLMQEGTIKTKGQLFQLLQSTGAFGQESKKVAAEWSKITDEKRAAILDNALNKIATRFESVPKTVNNWRTSLENLGDIAKEQIGEPFMNALAPTLEEVTQALIELRPDLVAFAEMVGVEFKGGVKSVAEEIRAGIQWVKGHKEDLASIGSALKGAWGFAKDVASFIIAHKAEMAIIFGAAVGGHGLAQGLEAAVGLKNAMQALPGALNKSVGAVNAFTIALGVAVLAGYELGKALTELIDLQTEQNPIVQQANALDAASKAADTGNAGKVDSIRQTQRNFAAGRGETLDAEMEQKFDIIEARAKLKASSIQIDAVLAANALQHSSEAVGDALRKSGQQHYEASTSYADRVLEATASKVVMAYNQAIANGDMAAAAYAANMINGSTQLQEAFLQSGLTISGGIDQFSSMLYSKSDMLAKGLASLAGGDKLGGKTGNKTNNFFAGSTGSGSVKIDVNQNFRNADPDRVAIAFKRDIMRAAENRYAAKTSSPFGG